MVTLAPTHSLARSLQDYFNVVKHPMDMGTIKMKLENSVYHSGQECVEDFRLMFKNCFLYNKPSDVSCPLSPPIDM